MCMAVIADVNKPIGWSPDEPTTQVEAWSNNSMVMQLITAHALEMSIVLSVIDITTAAAKSKDFLSCIWFTLLTLQLLQIAFIGRQGECSFCCPSAPMLLLGFPKLCEILPMWVALHYKMDFGFPCDNVHDGYYYCCCHFDDDGDLQEEAFQ